MALTDYKGLSVLDDDNPAGVGGEAIHSNFKILADRWDLSMGMIYLTDYADLVSSGSWTPAFDAALADCASESKPLWIGAGTYLIKDTIVLQGPDLWGLEVFGPGAIIQVDPSLGGGAVDTNVFEFDGWDSSSGETEGGHMKFHGFTIQATTGDHRGIGFGFAAGVNIPKGTSWHNITCRYLFAGWDFSGDGSFTHYWDHITSYGCGYGIRVVGSAYPNESLLGTSHIANSMIRRFTAGGIHVTNSVISLAVTNCVIEAGGASASGIRLVGVNFGHLEVRTTHFEGNSTHLNLECGGMTLVVEGCIFASSDLGSIFLKQTEDVGIPGGFHFTTILETSFRNNRYGDTNDWLTLNSALDAGSQVFDTEPIMGAGAAGHSQRDFAYKDSLSKWEWDVGASGIYTLETVRYDLLHDHAPNP